MDKVPRFGRGDGGSIPSEGKFIIFMLKRTAIIITIAGVFFIIGIATAPKIHPRLRQIAREPISQLRASSFEPDKYKFIDPLLGCEASEQNELHAEKLKNKLEKLASDAKRSGAASTISIYFDTRDGRWLGINTEENYYPASLLKAQLMMAYFKATETTPDILSKKISYQTQTSIDDQYFPPTSSLKIGQTYTIEELIERMIRYSDNNATDLLMSNVNNYYSVKKVFTDLGLPLPQSGEEIIDFMPIKSYARFFRVLYNASYLRKKLSEKALELLSMTDFNSGITKPLPNNIMVAHKFGERTVPPSVLVSQKAYQELHDCGIIYHPKKPYLLCIMTKGSDPTKLAEQIQNISKITYDYITNDLK